MRRWLLVVGVPLVGVVFGCLRLGIGGRGPTLPLVVSSGPADNGRCHVCHINYEEEELATDHAAKGVGCETCHGPSDDHCGDENNITPPDVMYPRETISPLCLRCHSKKELAEQEMHGLVLAGTPQEKKACTECHDYHKHRLERRTVRWDKRTRKLLPEDG